MRQETTTIQTNAHRQFIRVLVKFKIHNKAIDYIADKAIELKTGARGLRALFEHIMLDAMYDMPSNKKIKEFTVNVAYVKKKLSELKLDQPMVA